MITVFPLNLVYLQHFYTYKLGLILISDPCSPNIYSISHSRGGDHIT